MLHDHAVQVPAPFVLQHPHSSLVLPSRIFEAGVSKNEAFVFVGCSRRRANGFGSGLDSVQRGTCCRSAIAWLVVGWHGAIERRLPMPRWDHCVREML